MNGLKYIGSGGFVVGVPARDLTDDEVKLFGKARLLASGLYAEIYHRQKPAREIPPETTDNAYEELL